MHPPANGIQNKKLLCAPGGDPCAPHSLLLPGEKEKNSQFGRLLGWGWYVTRFRAGTRLRARRDDGILPHFSVLVLPSGGGFAFLYLRAWKGDEFAAEIPRRRRKHSSRFLAERQGGRGAVGMFLHLFVP